MNQIAHRQRLRKRAGLSIDQPLTPTTMAVKPVKPVKVAPSTEPPAEVPVQQAETVPTPSTLEPVTQIDTAQSPTVNEELTSLSDEPAAVAASPLATLPFSTDTSGMTPAEQQALADDITLILAECSPTAYPEMLDSLGAANPVLHQIVVDKLTLLAAQ